MCVCMYILVEVEKGGVGGFYFVFAVTGNNFQDGGAAFMLLYSLLALGISLGYRWTYQVCLAHEMTSVLITKSN